MSTIKKFWATIVLVISSIAIINALIAEYVFDILPCQMCLYQRYPYYFIILISLIYIVSKKIPLEWYYWTNTLSFAIGLFFSAWHVGIEQKILPGLSGCSSTINLAQSLTELKEQILNQNIIIHYIWRKIFHQSYLSGLYPSQVCTPLFKLGYPLV